MTRSPCQVVDADQVWSDYVAGQQVEIALLTQLVAIGLAKDQPDIRAIKDVILARARVRAEVIEMGQGLGVYATARKSPQGLTLGAIHEWLKASQSSETDAEE